MMDIIVGLAGLAGLLFAAFFAGGRKERKANETEAENTRIATQDRIKGAIRDADVDWRGELHKRK